MIKFSNLEIKESDLQPEFITTVNEDIQSWARVVVSLKNLDFFDEPIEKCHQWLSENAIDDYKMVVHQSNNYDSPVRYIHDLVIRFKDPSDAILFKLTDPLSDDMEKDLPF